MIVTVVASLLAAVGSRHLTSFFEHASLSPNDVFRGQIYRLVTWAFIEPSPVALAIGCIMLYMFGRDLCGWWGSNRFLRIYAGLIVTSAVGTCLIALVDDSVRHHTYLGSTAVFAAVIVAWGLCFPERVIRLWFIISLRGVVIAWLTIAFTVAYTAYYGLASHLPELLAEGAILAYLYQDKIRSRWKRARDSFEHSSRQRARLRRIETSKAYLRKVEAEDDDLAPLPDEIEKTILESPRRGRVTSIFDRSKLN